MDPVGLYRVWWTADPYPAAAASLRRGASLARRRGVRRRDRDDESVTRAGLDAAGDLLRLETSRRARRAHRGPLFHLSGPRPHHRLWRRCSSRNIRPLRSSVPPPARAPRSRPWPSTRRASSCRRVGREWGPSERRRIRWIAYALVGARLRRLVRRVPRGRPHRVRRHGGLPPSTRRDALRQDAESARHRRGTLRRARWTRRARVGGAQGRARSPTAEGSSSCR